LQFPKLNHKIIRRNEGGRENLGPGDPSPQQEMPR
jgi:hypothetical protein